MDRKEFTKRCLADALIELLKDKEYHEISINDITTKSGFSRMSYYRNFNCVDDILNYYLDVRTDEFIESSHIDFEKLPLETYMIQLFNFLGTPDCREISSLLMKRGLFDRIGREFDVRFKTNRHGLRAYYYSFIAGGTFNTYKLWVLNNYTEKPEEIVKAFLAFTRYYEIYTK